MKASATDPRPAKALRRLIQVTVADQFQTRRYDLKKVTMVCNPVAKSGAPVALGGPTKGEPFPIDQATVRHATAHLVCYQAKPAKTTIAQNGCVPANPNDKGTKIVPAQANHMPRLGVHLANQFGAATVDTKKEVALCIPSAVLP